ncbi:MAG: hypothetical protein Q8R13_05525 [bacterium]|nr:hypothetical protein [bacterium]MDZ4296455.1 hypothetical protein [Patescibacteria group bacterium]
MKQVYQLAAVVFFALLVGVAFYSSKRPEGNGRQAHTDAAALAAAFAHLSQQGNSACSEAFGVSILEMPDDERVQGSCCSAMDFHRYTEQVEGLRQYRHIPEIPPDPYDIEAGLAKRLLGYYDMELTAEEQRAYDYAMEHSHEKGPCCCRCWRWYVYGGLGKYLIRRYGFTGEQLTEVWNLSDGCGGSGEHVH